MPLVRAELPATLVRMVRMVRTAKAVVAKLAALGVPAGRLQAKGYGASQPVASNDSPEGRQRNRRVELVRVN